jgi:hypothetical protein
MRIVGAAIVMFCLGGLDVWAQAPAPGFNSTVGVVGGLGKTWDDEGAIGSGALVGGRADRRLFGHTFAEISIDYLRHDRIGRFTAEGHTILVSGVVVQRFGDRDAQPYALGGITVASHSGTFGFPELNLVSSTSSTSLGYVFGGGLALRAGTRFEVGPEARFLAFASDADSSPAFAYWIGGRFGVRF